MKPITRQVAEKLDGLGFGRFDPDGFDGNIFINIMPAEPDIAIMVKSQGGPERSKKGYSVIVAIQIMIRTVPEYPFDGEEAAIGIVDAFHGFDSGPLIPGGPEIFDITAQQTYANHIGQDQNGRHEYSQNFLIEYLI